MDKKRLLFIDDEPFFAEPYIRELEKDYEVILEESAINAIDAVNSARNWSAIILDIMMPSPPEKLGATADGLDTGLWLLGEIIGSVKLARIPVIILTNRNLPRVEEAIDEIVEDLDLEVDLIIVRSKIETPRFLLPRIVKGCIDRIG
jgi:CheY-like chemotaxis protein